MSVLRWVCRLGRTGTNPRPRGSRAPAAARFSTEEWLTDELVRDLVEEAEDDWVSVRDIAFFLGEAGHPVAGLQERAVSVAFRLMRQGLIEPGVYTANGFEPWPVSLEEAMVRMVDSAADDFVQTPPGWVKPAVAHVCWIAPTAEAHRRYGTSTESIAWPRAPRGGSDSCGPG